MVAELDKISEVLFAPEKDGEASITKRARQTKETKKKIFQAALHEIDEKGYENILVEDITSYAGVAKGSFYTHFKSKEDLVRYIYYASDEIYKSVFKEIKDMPFEKQMETFFYEVYKENEKRGKGILKAMIANYYSAPAHNPYHEKRLFCQCITRIIKKGKKEGRLSKDTADDVYRNYLVSVCVGLEILWCYDEGDKKLSDMIKETFGVIKEGLLAIG